MTWHYVCMVIKRVPPPLHLLQKHLVNITYLWITITTIPSSLFPGELPPPLIPRGITPSPYSQGNNPLPLFFGELPPPPYSREELPSPPFPRGKYPLPPIPRGEFVRVYCSCYPLLKVWKHDYRKHISTRYNLFKTHSGPAKHRFRVQGFWIRNLKKVRKEKEGDRKKKPRETERSKIKSVWTVLHKPFRHLFKEYLRN